MKYCFYCNAIIILKGNRERFFLSCSNPNCNYGAIIKKSDIKRTLRSKYSKSEIIQTFIESFGLGVSLK